MLAVLWKNRFALDTLTQRNMIKTQYTYNSDIRNNLVPLLTWSLVYPKIVRAF